jgi:hypothetical protein
MIKFSSLSSGLFNSLGITSTLTGITLTIGVYDPSSGSTLSTSIVPTALNYIKGSALTGTLSGSSFQAFGNNILSLTTQSTRLVEISFIDADPTNGSAYLQVGAISGSSGTFCSLRCIRGPSTRIGANIVGNGINSPNASQWGLNSVRFIDFSPISGAATYIIEAQTGNGAGNGASVTINFSNASLFVRQI